MRFCSKFEYKSPQENHKYGLVQQVRKLHFFLGRVYISIVWALIGNIIKLAVQYRHIVIGNNEENDYIALHAIYKFWIMAENRKLNFSTANIVEFVKKDLFNRTLYNSEKYFISLCDLVIIGL